VAHGIPFLATVAYEDWGYLYLSLLALGLASIVVASKRRRRWAGVALAWMILSALAHRAFACLFAEGRIGLETQFAAFAAASALTAILGAAILLARRKRRVPDLVLFLAVLGVSAVLFLGFSRLDLLDRFIMSEPRPTVSGATTLLPTRTFLIVTQRPNGYAATYAWLDAQGHLERSEPVWRDDRQQPTESAPYTVEFALSRDIREPQLSLTMRYDGRMETARGDIRGFASIDPQAMQLQAEQVEPVWIGQRGAQPPQHERPVLSGRGHHALITVVDRSGRRVAGYGYATPLSASWFGCSMEDSLRSRSVFLLTPSAGVVQSAGLAYFVNLETDVIQILGHESVIAVAEVVADAPSE
jgi:hypothetical protein